jgi:cytochrome c biogenesis protein CcmG, thiol:disulfide interchange protein DsbE
VRGRLAAWVAAPVLVVMLGFIVVLGTSEPAADRETGSPLLGRQAPPIEGRTVDGSTFDLADHSGGFVLVNMFATWCTPCIREHPELVEFQRRHPDDATVVSVVFDDSEDNVRRFFEENGGDWPVVTDPDGRIALSYAVARVPESYLIAPDGTVVTKLAGGVTADGLDRLLTQAREALR